MSLNGYWYNELGSRLNISIGGDGILTGYYETAVGNAQGQYALTGRADQGYISGYQSLGFTVTWFNSSGNSYSTTSWNGLYGVINGQETITAVWLLSSELSGARWNSTLVGEDTFTRQPPNEDTKNKATNHGRWSHPDSFANDKMDKE